MTFRNASPKEVVFVLASLTFFSKEGGDAPDMVPFRTFVSYGAMDGSMPHVPPGEAGTLSMKDEEYANLKRSLINNRYPLSFRHVEVIIDGVLFSDGLYWLKGRNYYRDPLNPEKWIRDKEFMKGGKYENMKPVGLLRNVPGNKNSASQCASSERMVNFPQRYFPEPAFVAGLQPQRISEPREFHKLRELGLTTFDLDYKDSKRKDQYGNLCSVRSLGLGRGAGR